MRLSEELDSVEKVSDGSCSLCPFMSNGNHRANAVLDNCEDVVFRRLAIKMHTLVRKQTDTGVYWYA